MADELSYSKADADAETRAYQEQTSSMRFKLSLLQGIAGPTLFGLVAAGGAALLKSATFTWGMGLLATAGIATLAVVGIACLYFTSRLGSELARVEQDHHAQQIAKGISGVTPVVEPQKPTSFPSHGVTPDQAANAIENVLADAPATTITPERSLENRVVPMLAAKEQPAAKPANFAERVAANDEQPAQTHVRA